MHPKKFYIAVICLGLSGLFGIVGFWRGFLSPLTEITITDFLTVRLPFLTGLLLLLAATGFFFLKSWASLLARVALVFWICSGIAAIQFLWTFHPWGDIALKTKLRLVVPYFIIGVVAPTFGLFALRKVPGTR